MGEEGEKDEDNTSNTAEEKTAELFCRSCMQSILPAHSKVFAVDLLTQRLGYDYEGLVCVIIASSVPYVRRQSVAMTSP